MHSRSAAETTSSTVQPDAKLLLLRALQMQLRVFLYDLFSWARALGSWINFVTCFAANGLLLLLLLLLLLPLWLLRQENTKGSNPVRIVLNLLKCIMCIVVIWCYMDIFLKQLETRRLPTEPPVAATVARPSISRTSQQTLSVLKSIKPIYL